MMSSGLGLPPNSLLSVSTGEVPVPGIISRDKNLWGRKIVKRIPWIETIAFGQLDLKELGQTHFRHRKQHCRLIDLPGAQI